MVRIFEKNNIVNSLVILSLVLLILGLQLAPAPVDAHAFPAFRDKYPPEKHPGAETAAPLVQPPVDSHDAVFFENSMSQEPVGISVSSFSSPETGSGEEILSDQSAKLLLEPAGCQAPPQNHTRLRLGDVVLNQRTYTMLNYAAAMYGGEVDITGRALIKGGYLRHEPSGTGIYSGGGVLDIAIIDNQDAEVEPLVMALRIAGFAAWLRENNELYPGSPRHIHAVAVGDERLSTAAQQELTGEYGYFRGASGLASYPDPHGGPVLCQWMIDAGYADLRSVLQEPEPQPVEMHWQEKLRRAAEAYITTSMEETVAVAREIDFIEGEVEHPANMCGPLSAAILRDAGLFPSLAKDVHTFWLANPRKTNLPWSLFPEQDFEISRTETPADQFDFKAHPLLPADFVYTYASFSGYDHMFVVTEVDEAGRAYTVSNQWQDDGSFLVERLLLYDPGDPAKGVFRDEWAGGSRFGRTGNGGFAVARRKGFALPPGTVYKYLVQPGDTIQSVAGKFDSNVEAIAHQNATVDIRRLVVGSRLLVPVNIGGMAETSEQQLRAAIDRRDQAAALVSHDVLVDDANGEAFQPAVTVEAVSLRRSAAVGPGDLVDIRQRVEDTLEQVPSGDWGIYIEDLDSGSSVSIGEDIVFHPASTIKIAVGMVFLHWMDEHPDVELTHGPVQGQRNYEQLLKAMLVKSEEEATRTLIDFLNKFEGYEVQTVVENWGLQETTIRPRRTTITDQALLLRLLHDRQVLSNESTELLLGMLRTPSNGDDERLGGGLPDWARINLAHKPGTVFDDGWGVVSDIGLVEMESGSYTIVIMSNYVDWVDYDEAQAVISGVSSLMFEYLVEKDGPETAGDETIAGMPQDSQAAFSYLVMVDKGTPAVRPVSSSIGKTFPVQLMMVGDRDGATRPLKDVGGLGSKNQVEYYIK